MSHMPGGTTLTQAELHQRRSDKTDNAGCTANRHGTADAYQHHGCRCPIARRALRRQVKARQLAHLEGRPPLVDATGTRRRLQALAAAGHSLADVAALLERTRNTVHDWRTRNDPVTRTTHDAVAAVYLVLADRPAAGPRAARVRNDARHRGWLGPLWWDDDTIDDPLFIPTYTHSSQHTADAVYAIDPIVVERLIAGQPPLHVTRSERAEAVRRLYDRGKTPSEISVQLHMSGGRVAQILERSVRPEIHTADTTNDRQEASA